LYNKIYDGIMDRLKDNVAEIRSQVVTALKRLQDSKDEECYIIRADLFHLAHNPNNVARRTIVMRRLGYCWQRVKGWFTTSQHFRQF
jgi:hypothetical protein